MLAATTPEIADYRNRHVVVTGGTGALGTALVTILIEAGATCQIPYVDEAEAERFPLRGSPQVRLLAVKDLADEAEVAEFYAVAPGLWASIHIAGGFAAAKIADTDKAAFVRQIDTNLITCFLCCRAAVKAMKKRQRRTHRQRRRAAGT